MNTILSASSFFVVTCLISIQFPIQVFVNVQSSSAEHTHAAVWSPAPLSTEHWKYQVTCFTRWTLAPVLSSPASVSLYFLP
jgi:hypothetical protein